MELTILAAMEATKWTPDRGCWWTDLTVAMAINQGTKMGWLLRTSVTQVEWTQKGADAVADYVDEFNRLKGHLEEHGMI